MQFLLQVQQPLALALHHAGDRNTGPFGDHLGNLVGIHLLVNHSIVGLQLFKLYFKVGDLLLGLLDAAITQFGHLAVVAGTLGLFGLQFIGLDVLYFCLYGFDHALLVLPAGLHLVALLTQFAQFLVELRKFVLVVLTLDGFAFDFQLADAVLDFVQLFGNGVNLDTQFGCRLVDEVDGFVGEETIADVAVAQLGSGNEGVILDTHLVMHLIAFLQTTQDADGVLHAGLVDKHTLETAFEGFVFLEIFLIFGQSGGTDGA